MKLLLDFLPIVLFFVAFKMFDIYVATKVAILASVLQIAYMLIRKQKVEPMQWASLVIIAIFGGMTLYFHDEAFVKLKPTVLYALFGVALLVSRYAFSKNAMKLLMGKQIELPEAIWDRVNIAWVVFFLSMAVVNIWVANNFPTETWVNFKLFGTMGLTLVFIVAQAVYLGRHSSASQHTIQAAPGSRSEHRTEPSKEGKDQ